MRAAPALRSATCRRDRAATRATTQRPAPKQICLSSSYYDTQLKGTTASGGKFNCAKVNAPQCIVHPTWTSAAEIGPTGFGGPANATWDSLWNGNATGSYNTVKPLFTNFSLQDQFRPNDKLLINAAIRYDNFTYDLPDSATAADQFFANMTSNYTCVYAATNQVLTTAACTGRSASGTGPIRQRRL